MLWQSLTSIQPQSPSTPPLEQKWVTSLELATDPLRDKPQFKSLTLLPGLYLSIGFCETNKDPIYEVEFFQKPPPDWIPLKISHSGLDVLGAYLCFKTQKSETAEPLSDLEILNVEKKSRFGENKEVINVPAGFKLISHSLPYGYLIYRKIRSKAEQTFKSILTEKYPVETKEINLAQLPIFCFPEGIKLSKEIRGFSNFNFIFTLGNGDRVYVNCLLFKENLSEGHRKKLDLKLSDNIFYEKALCLVSRFRYTDQFGECLQRLYRLSMSKNNVPFWKIAQSLTQQLTYPTEVPKFGLSYSYKGPEINFATNECYPFVSERSIYTVFKFLTVEHIISVFEALLLEKKIFFVSQSKTVLGYACQAFTSFLFPFKWEQVLIPILSSTLKQYLNAPVPLIAGISPSLVESSIESESVIVHLDRNEVLNDEDLPPLPEKLVKQLRKRLERLEVYDPEQVTQYLENHESTYLFKMQEVQDPHFHGNEIRDIFLQFLLTLMRNYKRFWCKPKEKRGDSSFYEFGESQLLNDIFKVRDFLEDLGMTKVGSFGVKFTQSSIFTSFIEKRQRSPFAPDIKFFDACIEKRKAKKQMKFILPVYNEEYLQVKLPEPDEADKFYQYDRFPSLFEENPIKEEEIMLEVQEQKSEEQKLLQIIEEEYFLNSELYEPSSQDFQQLSYKQINDLLLNKNKSLFPKKHQSDRLLVFNWFLETYTAQSIFIDNLLADWPSIPSTKPFKKVPKKQYLVLGVKGTEDEIIGVESLGEIQILICGDDKIMIGGNTKSFTRREQLMTIVCSSARLKTFLNQMIPRNASWLVEYCRSKVMADMRKSSFRSKSFYTWTVETVMEFREWVRERHEGPSTAAKYD